MIVNGNNAMLSLLTESPYIPSVIFKQLISHATNLFEEMLVHAQALQFSIPYQQFTKLISIQFPSLSLTSVINDWFSMHMLFLSVET